MDISIEEIEAAAAGMKEDLQRKANQGILRNDLNRAMAALAGLGHIDEFVYLLKIRAGSQLRTFVPRRRGRPKKASASDQDQPAQYLLPGTAGPTEVKKRKSA